MITSISKQLVTGRRSRRDGIVAVQVLVLLTVLVGFAALTIDVGYLYVVKGELQTAADAAALAGASQLPDDTAVLAVAQQFATINSPGHGTVLADFDVRFGNWDSESGGFTEGGGASANAVRVIVRRSEVNGNPVGLFFAGILGFTETDVSASATAAVGNCFDRGIIVGRFINIDSIEFEDIGGNFCASGRQGVTVDELELENSTLTLGALDASTIVINEFEGPGLRIVETGIQPTRAQRVGELIDGTENGTYVEPGTNIVVLSGPITFGDSEDPGDIVPQSHTAYVVNGDVTFVDEFEFTGTNLTLAVRGSIRFDEDVELHSTPPSSSAHPPLTMLASLDITMGDEVEISGSVLIAGQDIIFEDDFEVEEGSYGLAIEAGRDVIMLDEFELEELDLEFAVPFGGSTAPTLVQ